MYGPNPKGGSGGPGKYGPPNDPPDTDHTEAADVSNYDRNIEAKEMKQQTDIIFNYDMHKLHNRALNFALLPFKLDITQLLVDFNRFSRAVIWQEFWYGRNKGEDYIKPIFRSHKKTFPKTIHLQVALKPC